MTAPFIAALPLAVPAEPAFLVRQSSNPEAVFVAGPFGQGQVEDHPHALSLALRGQRDVFAVDPNRAERLFRPIVTPQARPLHTRHQVFGPSAEPIFSLIIPFFGEAFFMTCVFDLHRVLDRRFEIVIVVDDPRLWPTLSSLLESRKSWFKLRTVLVRNSRNAGYAAATNAGARYATGAVLFLMNSDVYVDGPEILGLAGYDLLRMRAENRRSIIGFTLKYEDNSIQHVGMEFKRSKHDHKLFFAEHPMKGIAYTRYEGAPIEPVQAVTGALLAIAADFFRELDGMDESYVRGDFEDADLCLRARQHGADILLYKSPDLYHLERQSIPSLGDVAFRHMITFVNAIKFNRRWHDTLSQGGRTFRVRPKRGSTPDKQNDRTDTRDGGDPCAS